MDETTIDPGQEWPQEIQEAVLGCRAMLVIIGPYWLKAQGASGARRLDDPKDWVRQEVEGGLARPALIPVLVDGATMPNIADLPQSLRPLHDRNAFVLAGVNFDQEVDALANAIRRGLLGAPQPTETGQPRAALAPEPD